MSGTTYSRTSGHAILPGTWAWIKGRGDIPDADKLSPSERYDYDTAGLRERETFRHVAMDVRTAPPDFLRFALSKSGDALAVYEGEGPSGAHVGSGILVGMSGGEAAARLGVSKSELDDALRNFSGDVTLVVLPAGTEIYRTVGLTANPSALAHGWITNKLLGTYWEAASPDSYASLGEWRASMAVLAEWNGDYGYVAVRLGIDVPVLSGTVAEQRINRAGHGVLPGGGHQYFIPHLQENQLAESISGRTLQEIIRETTFHGGHR